MVEKTKIDSRIITRLRKLKHSHLIKSKKSKDSDRRKFHKTAANDLTEAINILKG